MDQIITRLAAIGLHGRFDIDFSFSDGVNIIHGANGAGKTTLLHVLTNAANLDLERFVSLKFDKITLETSNGSVFQFSSLPGEGDRQRPATTLSIDGDKVASWPPPRNEISHTPTDVLMSILSDEIQEARTAKAVSIEATYFPAFRTMIEAWSSIDPDELVDLFGVGRRRPPPPRGRLRHRRAPGFFRPMTEGQLTFLARQVFGAFVPSIRYPSPLEIEQQLDRALQRAVNQLASDDRYLLSNAFNRVFEAISQDSGTVAQDTRSPQSIRSRISDQLEQLRVTQSEYGLPDSDSAFAALRTQLNSSDHLGQDHAGTTTRILKVYEEALTQRESNLRAAFRPVREYIDVVNQFLDGKQLVTEPPVQEPGGTPQLQIKHDDGELVKLDTLSSGERQIAGLIYSASHIARGSVILVDEPELSLHINWQRDVIGAMVAQFPAKQLIVCTHSPTIGAAYRDKMTELLPVLTSSSRGQDNLNDDIDDAWSELDEFEETV